MAREFTIEWETKKFHRQINNMIARYPQKKNIILKKFALDLVKCIVQENPVDTGRSRAAWYPSMVGLGFAGAEAMLQKPSRHSGQRPTEGGIRQGKKEGSFKPRLALGPYSFIDMVNNVKYILFLEYGHSKQSPWGMVRVSMRELRGGKLPRELGKEMQKLWYIV